MHEKKSFVLESLGFAFRSLIEQIRLFVIVLLTATGIISLVVGLIAFLNKGFINAVMTSQVFQDYQQCIGYNCATVAYNSGATIRSLVSSHLVSLVISVIVLALFFAGLDLGFKKVALDIHDRRTSSLQSMFSCFYLAPKALIAWMLYCTMVWIGWLLFVLPGFIALLRFAFFPYFIVDKNVGPIDALKMSYNVTKDHMWDMFAFWVTIKIIVYLGFVSWLGVIITWPLSTLAYAYFYRKLVQDNALHHTNYSDLRVGA